MDLFGIKKLRQEVSSQKGDLQDVKAKLIQSAERVRTLQEELRTRRRTLQKPLQYRTPDSDSMGPRRGGSSFYGPLHDLGEIARAIDVEAYIAVSVRKHREQILKESFSIAGEDEEMVEYIEQRLFEMTLASGVTTESWIREFTTQLVQYASAFLVIRRDVNKSTGSTIRWRGKKLLPIAAVFPMDATSVKIRSNKHGHPIEYMQRVEDAIADKSVTSFPTTDVIMATMDKKTGFQFGTPYILPVLDDVRALRRIEEITELVAQKHAWPFIHWKVGNKDEPIQDYHDGTTDIDVVKSELQNMPAEGGIVTKGNVEASVMGMQDKAIDLKPYLEYFERRVLSGLRLAPEDMGRAESNKASAITASESLQDSSKDIQSVIMDVITYQLFLPLLLEGGFDVTKDNIVRLQFGLINREEERARQAHGNDLYQGGSISKTEFRRDYLGSKEMAEEECLDCVPERNHEWDVELARMAAAAKAASAASSSSSTSKKKADNANRPINQSGQKTIKTRIKANDTVKELFGIMVDSHFTDCRESLRDFINKHGIGVNDMDGDSLDMTTKDAELQSILSSFVTFSMSRSRELISGSVDLGIQESLDNMSIEGEYSVPKKNMDRFFKNTIQKGFNNFASAVYVAINNDESLSGGSDTPPLVSLSSILDASSDSLKLLTYKFTELAFRFGYTRAAKSHRYKSIILTPDEEHACESCLESGSREVSLIVKDIPYRTLLDSHSTCAFDISLGQKE